MAIQNSTTKWMFIGGGVIVAAAVVVFFQNYPPQPKDAARTIGAAQRYHEPQITGADVKVSQDEAAVEAYLELQRYDDELEPVRGILHLDTNDPEALYRLGIMFEEMAAYRSALETFRKMLTIRPNDSRAQRNIGFVLLKQAKPEDAIEPLEAALEIDPSDWKAHAGLSAAYTQISRSLGDAWLAKQKAIDYRSKATDEARESVRLNPDDHRPWYRLGTSLLDDLRTLPEAIDAFQRAVAIRPHDTVLLRVLTIAKQRVSTVDGIDNSIAATQPASPLVRIDPPLLVRMDPGSDQNAVAESARGDTR